MTFDALRPLADRAAYFTALRQDQLRAATDSLGPNRWDVDMTAGTITFTSEANPQQQIVGQVRLLASIAPGPRSVLWGWAHPLGQNDPVAAQLREYGTQYGVESLSNPEVAFPADTGPDLDAWIIDASHVIGGVAAEITGHSPYYSAPTGGGTRAVFALDGLLGPLTVAETVIAFPRIMSQTAPSDQRTSVWDLARLAAWQMTWTDEHYTGATVSDATGTAIFRFDQNARVLGLEGGLGGAGAPPYGAPSPTYP